MGTVHKLTLKIKNYIVKKKQEDPDLSCRKIAALIDKKFKAKVSKSAINLLIKQTGLSMPIGRRRKRKRSSIESEGLGAIILKAADYIAGGTKRLVEAVKNKAPSLAGPIAQAKIEAGLYLPLFEKYIASQLKPDFGLWILTNRKFTQKGILSYLDDLQGVTGLNLDISQLFPAIFQEVRCMKVGLSTETNLYLDGQLHTVWSTPQIPYDFSTTICSIKSYIDRYFQKNEPLVLLMAPGYDIPKKEFFDFVSALDIPEKEFQKLTLYDNKMKEIETVRLADPKKKRFFLFGLWPWQFVAHRKVKSIGQFRPFSFAPTKENFYIAEIEMEISQPPDKQAVTLKGCALKTRVWEKERVIVLSNLPQPETNAERLAELYLSRWPTLEEAFQDVSRKIELFTYHAAAQRFFSTENLDLGTGEDIKGIFKSYLQTLDLYARWHLMPSGYEGKDFSAANERFYSLKAELKRHRDYDVVTFLPSSGYAYMNDLEYICRRLNEREIIFSDAKRLWFHVE